MSRTYRDVAEAIDRLENSLAGGRESEEIANHAAFLAMSQSGLFDQLVEDTQKPDVAKRMSYIFDYIDALEMTPYQPEAWEMARSWVRAMARLEDVDEVWLDSSPMSFQYKRDGVIYGGVIAHPGAVAGITWYWSSHE